MTIKLKNEILFIDVLVVLLIVIIALFESGFLRVILGLPFLLFFPGYMLMAALFPGSNITRSIERVALSFALSVTVVAAVGFILNLTPWGFTLYPVLLVLASFILIISVVAWMRRRRLNEEERPVLVFTLHMPFWKRLNRVNNVLSIILLVAVLGTIGSLVYIMFTPKETDRFTEFYVLGDGSKVSDYPQELVVGETSSVFVRIVNYEGDDEVYRLETSIAGEVSGESDQIWLAHEETWEREVFFTPVKTGENLEIEFVLYKNNEPYRRLQLWVDVKEAG